MVIEHAERFGLAQLHQLRGRIGRGRHPSTCFLLTPGEVGEVARERLRTMTETQDGFQLADLDLKQRGPGEFFGTRQHGELGFHVAHPLRDKQLLEPIEAAPAPGAGPLELKIEAGRNTTLKVTADGKTLFDGRIEAGEQKRFQANQKLEISAGNSTALLLELNGQTVPPLGPPGEAGSVTLTHKDVKKPAGGQD